MTQYQHWKIATLALSVACAWHSATAHAAASTTTPIEHVIVIIGENHTFDNLFGGYRAAHGRWVNDLLYKGIIDNNGNPGPRFNKAAQQQALGSSTYDLAPAKTGFYATLPQPNTTYATGLPQNVPDARFPIDLPNGPFQITKYISYEAYVGDPVHRFFQMWQQTDQGKNDLFTWFAETAGIGPHNDGFGTTPDDTFQGGLAMGFYNMSTGDAPLFKQMARHYAISDNYHQSIMGGTGANFLALVTGDAGFYNTDGNPAIPPTQVPVGSDIVSQIENPDPQSGLTNANWYTEDGYRGGSYVKCSDPGQSGVSAILDYLASKKVDANCAPDTYYLVNNYGLGYTPDGHLVDPNLNPFTLPPQPSSLPTIADALAAKGISWKYYSGGRNDGVHPSDEYCGICDPLIAFTSIMTTDLKDKLQDFTRFLDDVADEKTVPAVSFIRPYESLAGHPANATVSGYEHFVADVVNLVKGNKGLWKKTAILITTDEGGGYYDSGYIQALDFFGDGTRIPLIVVSPYAKRGFVDHAYSDHASILKFIEKNWDLKPLSKRSRDNLPNPVVLPGHPYVPVNRPAIGDLMDMFDFSHFGENTPDT